MNNLTDNHDIADIEILKQIVHEKIEVLETTKATQKEEKEATPELPLELSLQRRLDELPKKDDKTVTIFRIPANIREREKMFYEPQVVSIGPFYRGRENLRAMEEQKVYLLRDFLARYCEIDIKVLVEEMRLLEDRARQCYAESINLDSREFVEMLLLDGCFILENAVKWLNNEPDRLKNARWATGSIFADLLLVENQIPFFVVMKLISLIQADKKKSTELLDLLVQYIGCFGATWFFDVKPFKVEAHSLRGVHNLVHLCYQIFTPKWAYYFSVSRHPVLASSSRCGLFNSFKLCFSPQPNQGDVKLIINEEETIYVLPCITELIQSGIIFKPKKSPADVLHITFENGVIEMPPLSLAPRTKTNFLNIVAFEQSNVENEYLPFSSYVCLMENLVKTSKDVVALRQCGIIYTFDPSEEEAALFFNHAGQLATLNFSKHYFANLFREIKCFYDGCYIRRAWSSEK
ncbi:hypothetical protein FCM35_KLT00299 [Carex littledalei]|uniref:Uncharacterized protein n=1 Tax=Carex littledalei TaxID=544730 RepID=A0A833RTR0_9POAL|nr:hypothetical protein FCM35_KLT00299 [Carex littledalei]